MKKALFILFAILLYSCYGDSSDNSPDNRPAAPSNLLGYRQADSTIVIYWTDNSNNETSFVIERKISGTDEFEIIASVGQDEAVYIDDGLPLNTTYTYCVYARNGSELSSASNEFEMSTAPQNIATVTTWDVTNVTDNSAQCGGTINDTGNTNVLACGVVWSTSPNPTIDLPTKTVDVLTFPEFVSNITGLMSNTTYYVKAYATNSFGTAYGNEKTFVTNETVLPITTVTIGSQVWTDTNLNVSKYRNGDPIPQVTDSNQWRILTTGAWCYYRNITANGTTYGKLYNWYAVNDPRGLAPTGYHVPSDAEWTTLITFLGGESVAGGKMKATTLWNSPNTAATNSSGFTGLPGGYRVDDGGSDNMGGYGYWWSSSEYSFPPPCAWVRALGYGDSRADRICGLKAAGFSVRCIKD